MDFSIIIPNYNTKKLTANCIRSIIEWTKDVTFEIIVVDNASTDGSVTDLKKILPSIRVISQKTNTGYGQACNAGVKQSRGKYLCLLNSDTVFLTDVLKEAKQKLERKGKIGILSPQLMDADGKIQPSAGYFPTIGNLLAWTFFFDDWPVVKRFFPSYHLSETKMYYEERQFEWLQAACWFIKKDLFLGLGGMDKDYFMYVEDIDFCYRLAKMNYQRIYDPKIRVRHLNHSHLTINRTEGEYKGLKLYFKKHHSPLSARAVSQLVVWNAFIRWLVFGILLGNEEKKQVYQKAWHAMAYR